MDVLWKLILCWKYLVFLVWLFVDFNPLATEGGDMVDTSWYVFVVFSYLLNFCRQWHLCKFLILGDLSTDLFGLVFLHPTSKKIGVGVGPTLSSINLGFFKTLFFKIVKNSLFCSLQSNWHFLYMFMFTHPQAPFRQLGPSFLGWKSK